MQTVSVLCKKKTHKIAKTFEAKTLNGRQVFFDRFFFTILSTEPLLLESFCLYHKDLRTDP